MGSSGLVCTLPPCGARATGRGQSHVKREAGSREMDGQARERHGLPAGAGESFPASGRNPAAGA